MASTHPRDLVAIDIDTGSLLSAAEATEAADNPFMYRWVRWIDPIDVPPSPSAIPATAAART